MLERQDLERTPPPRAGGAPLLFGVFRLVAAAAFGALLAGGARAGPGSPSPEPRGKAAVPAPAASLALAALLPGEALGYRPRGKDGVYTADTLFDLIDGGAEVYRSFHLRRAVSRRYGKPGEPEILADLFDMGSPGDAFGAYHHDFRDEPDAGVGVESELAGSSLAFWKDRYFVSIVALADTPGTRKAVEALGRGTAERIPRRGSPPDLLRLLPAEGLERGRLAYFHDWTYLNTRHSIADDNLLLLDGGTEGILARYRRPAGGPGGGSRLLLLARYSSPERARAALEKFRKGYLAGAGNDGIARRGDGKWAAAERDGSLVLVVLDADERPDMERLVSGLRKGGQGREERGHGQER